MAFKFEFGSKDQRSKCSDVSCSVSEKVSVRRSIVQVLFPTRMATLAYYNDRFDLKRGDLVFVDGKYEGVPGRITDVSYNFKIKVSDYQRVIALADTDVKGQFYVANRHLVSFDRESIPYQKVVTWFMPPAKEEDEYVSSLAVLGMV